MVHGRAWRCSPACRLPRSRAFGVVIIAGHNLFDLIPGLGSTLGESSLSGLWKILYLGLSAGPIAIGNDGPQLWVLSITRAVGRRDRGWLRVRGCADARAGTTPAHLPRDRARFNRRVRGPARVESYGDPRPWRSGLDVLNATKYPASLSFLLMTLGPTIAVMPLLDNARGAVTRWLTVFGRVPFFYYVLHIPLIHVPGDRRVAHPDGRGQ